MVPSKKSSTQDLFEYTQENLEQQLWSIVILLQSIFRPTSLKKLYGIESFHLEQHLKSVGMKIAQASPAIKQMQTFLLLSTRLTQYHSELLNFWQVYRKSVNLQRNDEKKLQSLLQKAQQDLKKIIDAYKAKKQQQEFSCPSKFNYPKTIFDKKKSFVKELNTSAPVPTKFLQQKKLELQLSQQSILSQKSQGNECNEIEATYRKEVEARKKEIEELEKEKAELSSENEFLKGMVDELQSDIQRYREKEGELAQEMSRVKQENERLKQAGKESRVHGSVHGSVQQESRSVHQELEQNQFLINQLKNKVESYEESLQQRDHLIQDLKEQLLSYQQSRKNSPKYGEMKQAKEEVKEETVLRYVNVAESYVSCVMNLLAHMFSFVELVQLYEDSDAFCGSLSQFFQFMKGDYKVTQAQLASASQAMVQQIELEESNFSNDFLFFVIDNVSHSICKDHDQQESYISQLLKTVDSPVFDLFFFCQRIHPPEKDIQPHEMPLVNSIKQIPYSADLFHPRFSSYLVNLSQSEGQQAQFFNYVVQPLYMIFNTIEINLNGAHVDYDDTIAAQQFNQYEESPDASYSLFAVISFDNHKNYTLSIRLDNQWIRVSKGQAVEEEVVLEKLKAEVVELVVYQRVTE